MLIFYKCEYTRHEQLNLKKKGLKQFRHSASVLQTNANCLRYKSSMHLSLILHQDLDIENRMAFLYTLESFLISTKILKQSISN